MSVGCWSREACSPVLTIWPLWESGSVCIDVRQMQWENQEASGGQAAPGYLGQQPQVLKELRKKSCLYARVCTRMCGVCMHVWCVWGCARVWCVCMVCACMHGTCACVVYAWCVHVCTVCVDTCVVCMMCTCAFVCMCVWCVCMVCAYVHCVCMCSVYAWCVNLCTVCMCTHGVCTCAVCVRVVCMHGVHLCTV